MKKAILISLVIVFPSILFAQLPLGTRILIDNSHGARVMASINLVVLIEDMEDYLGCEIVVFRGDTFAETISDFDCIMLPPTQYDTIPGSEALYTEEEKEALVECVYDGGVLIMIGEWCVRGGGFQSNFAFNRVLEDISLWDTGIRFTLNTISDSVFFSDSWYVNVLIWNLTKRFEYRNIDGIYLNSGSSVGIIDEPGYSIGWGSIYSFSSDDSPDMDIDIPAPLIGLSSWGNGKILIYGDVSTFHSPGAVSPRGKRIEHYDNRKFARAIFGHYHKITPAYRDTVGDYHHPIKVVFKTEVTYDPRNILIEYDSTLYTILDEDMEKVADTFIFYPRKNIESGDSIEFCFKDTMGIIFYGPICSKYYYVDTGIEESTPIIPDKLEISCYPNPFNSSIKITLVGAYNYRTTQLEIYNISGRLMNWWAGVLVGDGECPGSPVSRITGSTVYLWTPGENIPSGVYLVRAKSENEMITKRIVCLK